MSRSLRDVLAIVKELKAVYDGYQKAAGDGRISVTEGLVLAGKVLAVLNAHSVTLAELQDLLGEVGPLLALIQ